MRLSGNQVKCDSSLLFLQLRFECLLAFGNRILVALRIDPHGLADLRGPRQLVVHVEVRTVRAQEDVARELLQ